MFLKKLMNHQLLLTVALLTVGSWFLHQHLGRLFFSLPLLILFLAALLVFGLLSQKKIKWPEFFEKGGVLFWTVWVGALMSLALYLSVAGPYADALRALFYSKMLLFLGAILILFAFIVFLDEELPEVLRPLLMLAGLGVVILANKLFNVYGLLVLAHLLGVYLLLQYLLRHQENSWKVLAAIVLPVIFLLMERGLIQILIRSYFQSGLILNHNYSSIGLALGLLLPWISSKKLWPEYLTGIGAIILPFALLFFFYAEVVLVFLLSFCFASFALSLLEKRYELNWASMLSVLSIYLSHELLLDKQPAAVGLRFALFAALMGAVLLFYLLMEIKKKQLKPVNPPEKTAKKQKK